MLRKGDREVNNGWGKIGRDGSGEKRTADEGKTWFLRCNPRYCSSPIATADLLPKPGGDGPWPVDHVPLMVRYRPVLPPFMLSGSRGLYPKFNNRRLSGRENPGGTAF
jgi:hypothetical protein